MSSFAASVLAIGGQFDALLRLCELCETNNRLLCRNGGIVRAACADARSAPAACALAEPAYKYPFRRHLSLHRKDARKIFGGAINITHRVADQMRYIRVKAVGTKAKEASSPAGIVPFSVRVHRALVVLRAHVAGHDPQADGVAVNCL
eukprot:scaffold2069_cov254-Pinguiococcus_pyrenoidosus.AAC.25